MERLLKQYTIVPDSLYVERNADRQLKEIIDDMQRPGYVLVSRQMGKTNLLLNAKRKYESNRDIFVYIDLSNELNSEKDCFENMINITIDTHTEILNNAKDEILQLRKNCSKSHQLEHLDELRVLLKYIEGRLIIILDEIDALTKTTYSDNIFAQIRSIYFNRVNYPVLEKLTYILSGVVEPTEIIKNPKISPFNIGQKIYLNDFNRDEFNQFLNKSNILTRLTDESIERLYYWTKGNPRITWDVCYEIESLGLHEINFENIDSDKIDIIVHNVYLTSFDRPPVDNIREIVKNDRELREALIQLHYNKGNELSDKIKSKLYLAGIINYEEQNIIIKNEVIKKSLSYDWLLKVEEEEKGLITIALELQDKDDFKGSLDAFEKYLANNTFDIKKGGSLYYYYTGYAAYRISNFKKADYYLSLAMFDKAKDSPNYYRLINLKALNSLYYDGNWELSYGLLKEIIEEHNNDEIYFRAYLNSLYILRRYDYINSKEKLINSYQVLIDLLNGNSIIDLDNDLINEFKTTAYFNYAEIMYTEGKLELSKINYQNAYQLANEYSKLTIQIKMYNVLDSNDKALIIDEILEKLKGLDTLSNFNDPERSMEFDKSKFVEFAFYVFEDSTSNFIKISENLLKFISKGYGSALLELVYFGLNNKKKIDTVLVLLSELYNNIDNSKYDLNNESKQSIYQLCAIFENDISYSLKYVQEFNSNRYNDISDLDFEIFAKVWYYHFSKNDYSSANLIGNQIQAVKEFVDEKLRVNYIIFEYYKSILYTKTNPHLAITQAQKVINSINSLSENDISNSYLIKDSIDSILASANKILDKNQIIHTSSITPNKKIGRNDFVEVIYRGETTKKRIKYKYIEDDYKKGKCIIL